MKIQGSFQFITPAKVTLALNILRKREDGYHEVHLVLVPVSLYDTLTVRPNRERGIRLTVDSPEPLGPPEDNLVCRAARSFGIAVGTAPNADLHLEKRIPAGAGLGGGSGNAAGILVALNRAYGHPLSAKRMLALALDLGSDVPFFLDPRPCEAAGRGEKLRPLVGFPDLELLIVKPPLSISTAEAYGLAQPHPLAGASPPSTGVEPVLRGLGNDFESVLFPRYPVLHAIKTQLLEAGASGAVLSGSGSAVVGVFRYGEERDTAARQLADRDWSLFPCRVLQTHPYAFEN